MQDLIIRYATRHVILDEATNTDAYTTQVPERAANQRLSNK